jgi:peptidoglycan hydrolase-like protein with peptidoglycan-binding domain
MSFDKSIVGSTIIAGAQGATVRISPAQVAVYQAAPGQSGGSATGYWQQLPDGSVWLEVELVDQGKTYKRWVRKKEVTLQQQPGFPLGQGSPDRTRVRQVQAALNARGARLVVDGVWGPKTEAAAKAAGLTTPLSYQAFNLLVGNAAPIVQAPAPSSTMTPQVAELVALIADDKILLERGVTILKAMADLQRAGKPLPATYRDEANRLFARFVARQAELRNRFGSILQATPNAGWDVVIAYVKEVGLAGGNIFVKGLAVFAGAIPLALMLANELWTGGARRDQARDLEVSETLQKALDTLTPKEQEAVKTDLQQQIDTAFDEGKKADGGLFQDIKNTVFLVIGVTAVFFVGRAAVRAYATTKNPARLLR